MKLIIDIPYEAYHTFKCELEKGNPNLNALAKIVADGIPYEERPQGEWINREAVSNTIFPFWERYECNQCHKFNGYSNFCPNCGADMQKGGAE